ncbi:MAG: phage tail protein [Rhodobacteraceae bacterium]|nr:MAG: phage tail protein [Paracoccaceae bacterium]
MSDTPFIGEIIMFGGNFAPRDWALCDGQLLAITSNSALYSILGTTYGGDGRNTFGLPDLRGRVPMHAGSGPGLTSRPLGQTGGEQTVTLGITQIPPHTHKPRATDQQANEQLPGAHVMGDDGNAIPIYSNTPTTEMQDTTSAGGGQAHDNMQPYQVVNFIIALQGTYPSRS